VVKEEEEVVGGFDERRGNKELGSSGTVRYQSDGLVLGQL